MDFPEKTNLDDGSLVVVVRLPDRGDRPHWTAEWFEVCDGHLQLWCGDCLVAAYAPGCWEDVAQYPREATREDVEEWEANQTERVWTQVGAKVLVKATYQQPMDGDAEEERVVE